jgi:hypothetical protein
LILPERCCLTGKGFDRDPVITGFAFVEAEAFRGTAGLLEGRDGTDGGNIGGVMVEGNTAGKVKGNTAGMVKGNTAGVVEGNTDGNAGEVAV